MHAAVGRDTLTRVCVNASLGSSPVSMCVRLRTMRRLQDGRVRTYASSFTRYLAALQACQRAASVACCARVVAIATASVWQRSTPPVLRLIEALRG